MTSRDREYVQRWLHRHGLLGRDRHGGVELALLLGGARGTMKRGGAVGERPDVENNRVD